MGYMCEGLAPGEGVWGVSVCPAVCVCPAVRAHTCLAGCEQYSCWMLWGSGGACIEQSGGCAGAGMSLLGHMALLKLSPRPHFPLMKPVLLPARPPPPR